jgi:hypothetical protein
VGEGLLEPSAIGTFLRTGDRTLVVTDLGRIDILQGLPQVPSFAALDGKASEVDIDGLVVKVCSLDDLLAMKRAIDRPRDRDDLEALEEAREGREPGSADEVASADRDLVGFLGVEERGEGDVDEDRDDVGEGLRTFAVDVVVEQ